MKVGFIGLGSMGAPMAGHLIKGGHTLYLRDIGKIPPALVAAGGIECASAADVARKADVTIIMVPLTTDVANVLFGPDGVAMVSPPVLPPSPDPRTFTPAPPRAFTFGLRRSW